jgi:deoxycytidine triphosphate deaminase/uncharacterized coiled-coil protein SlyX
VVHKFQRTDEQAKERYDFWVSRDPFPDIPPALLHSADVSDYARLTGMIHEFKLEHLKASSYEVCIGDRYIYWDGQGKKKSQPLRPGQEFDLDPNSIIFVKTEEKFRLPHYIAARFNLRITNVHRGLLLGTGPLVDPGFAGHLLVPLHNLTTNQYRFRCGEKFAWFEFTKVSPHESWSRDCGRIPRQGKYVPFPERKRYLDPGDYLDKALGDVASGEIRSSIPQSILVAEQSAEKAAKNAETARRDATDAKTYAVWVRNIATGVGALAAAGVIAATASVIVATWQIISQTQHEVAEIAAKFDEALPSILRDVQSVTNQARETARTVSEINETVGGSVSGSIATQLAELRSVVSRLEERLEVLQGRISEERTPDPHP